MKDDAEQSIPSRGSHGSGITERLRGWAKADDSVWPSELMGEAAGEIDRLRLTDEEREAMSRAAVHYERQYHDYRDPADEDAAKTIRGLLARLN
jgi:hypothetical protein